MSKCTRRKKGQRALRKVQKPGFWVDFAEPGTAAQILATSADGPPMSVVPVSMAERAEFLPEISTFWPCTVTSIPMSMDGLGNGQRKRTGEREQPVRRCRPYYVLELYIPTK